MNKEIDEKHINGCYCLIANPYSSSSSQPGRHLSCRPPRNCSWEMDGSSHFQIEKRNLSVWVVFFPVLALRVWNIFPNCQKGNLCVSTPADRPLSRIFLWSMTGGGGNRNFWIRRLSITTPFKGQNTSGCFLCRFWPEYQIDLILV